MPRPRSDGHPSIPWRTVAQRLYPHARWVDGSGRWATITFDGKGTHVQLHSTLKAATYTLDLLRKMNKGVEPMLVDLKEEGEAEGAERSNISS